MVSQRVVYDQLGAAKIDNRKGLCLFKVYKNNPVNLLPLVILCISFPITLF